MDWERAQTLGGTIARVQGDVNVRGGMALSASCRRNAAVPPGIFPSACVPIGRDSSTWRGCQECATRL
jgi:hypothetical protein